MIRKMTQNGEKWFNSYKFILIVLIITNVGICYEIPSVNNNKQFQPNISYFQNGSFIIFYLCTNRCSTSGAICMSVFREYDSVSISDVCLIAKSNVNYWNPISDALSNGDVALTWISETESNIYFTIVSLSSTSVTPIKVTETLTNNVDSYLISLLNNKFIILWRNNGSNNVNYIYGKIFNNDSTVNKDSFIIKSFNSSYFYGPQACLLVNGNFIVTWSASDVDGFSNYSVFAQIYSESGVKIGGEINVNSEKPENNDFYSTVACLSNGNFVIAWRNHDGRDGDGPGCYLKLFNGAGIALTNDVLINSSTAGNQYNPFPIALQDGRFFAIFYGLGSASSGKYFDPNEGIYYQAFDSSGRKELGNFALTRTDKIDISPTAKRIYNGSYVIAWVSDIIGASTIITFENYFLDQLVNQYMYDQQSRPYIAALSDGNYAIAYSSFAQASSGYDVFCLIRDKNKQKIKSEFLLNTHVTNEPKYPKIGAFAKGDFAVIWLDNRVGDINFNGVLLSNAGNIILSETNAANCNEILDSSLINSVFNLLVLDSSNKLVIIWACGGFTYFKVLNKDLTVSKNKTEIETSSSTPNTPVLGLISSGGITKIIEANLDNILGFTDGFDILRRVYDIDFNLISPPIVVNTYTNNSQFNPLIVPLTNGRYVIAYQTTGLEVTFNTCAAQIFDFNGNKIGNEIILNSNKSSNQLLNSFAISSNYVYFAWSGQTAPNNYENITIGKFDMNLNKQWETVATKYKWISSTPAFNYMAVLKNTNQLILAYQNQYGDISDYSVMYEILEDCPLNYSSLMETNYICTPNLPLCDVSCSSCILQKNKCMSCAAGYYLVENQEPHTCFITPPAGYYLNSILNKYSLCDVSCSACVNSANNCTECKSGYYFLEDELGSCKNTLPPGYYFNSANKKYSLCDVSCNGCVGPAVNCISCKSGYYPLIDKKTTCKNIAPEGYRFDQVTNTYSLCDKSCSACEISANNCTACRTGFYLLENKPTTCLNTPLPGYYFNSAINKYSECDASCLTCLEAASKCISCQLEYYPLEDQANTCRNSAIPGYYLNASISKYSKCDISCKTCQALSSSCTSCNVGYYSLEDQPSTCTNSAPTGYYFNTFNNKYSKKDNSSTNCPKDQIKKKNSNLCIELNSCFDSVFFIFPKYFNLESQNFKASINCLFKENCKDLSNDIQFKWTEFPGALVSNDTYILEIPFQNLILGSLLLETKMMYNGIILNKFVDTAFIVINKLIPIIKNEEKLFFIHGYDIVLDASLSYDEGSLRSFSNSNEKIEFSWKCPDALYALCVNTKESILNIKVEDYKKLISFPISDERYNIELNITKDSRKASKSFFFILKKPVDIVKISDKVELSDFIIINPLSSVADNEKIFEFYFLDKNLLISDFSYIWTVTHFIQEKQYLNGRKETSIKILNEDLLIGSNEIVLEITNVNNKQSYKKIFNYEKNKPPYGGSCSVEPNKGISMQTKFTFILKGWTTKSGSLIYKIKYLNINKIFIDISKGGFMETKWSTALLPPAAELLAEITDSAGLTTTARCVVTVEANQLLEPLDDYLNKELEWSNRLFAVDIYKLNLLTQKNAQNSINNIKEEINNTNLDLLSSYLSVSDNSQIKNNLEFLIAKTKDITVQTSEIKKMDIVENSVKSIINNIDPLLQHTDKLVNVYSIIDNLISKGCDSFNSSTFASNSVDNNIERKKDVQLLKAMQKYQDNLNEKLFNNIINGQAMIIKNENFNIQMNKLSKLNVADLNVNYDSYYSSRRLSTKKTKIRYLQVTNSSACNEFSALCIPSKNLTEIMKSEDSKAIGFKSQLSHKDNLPIAEIQFSNSLDFSLTAEDSTGKHRMLDYNPLSFFFEVRLRMPPQNNNTNKITNSTCVQYSGDAASISCESWYDLDTNEVICYCNRQGITVNVLDKTLSGISKLMQFPYLSADIFNKYSIGIISAFIIILSVMFWIALVKDREDDGSLLNMRSEYYDKMQYYLVKLHKEGFKNNIAFIKLYFYLVKNMHPIIAIMNIYDPIYNRKIRVLDFFLKTYLAFFFTLLPFYVTDNSQLIDLAAKRSIINRNKSINDIEAKLKQFVESLIYSLFASVASLFITRILAFFLYEDILQKESEKKIKNITRALLLKVSDRGAGYKPKIKRVYNILNTIFLITREYVQKLHIKNKALATNYLKEEEFNFNTKYGLHMLNLDNNKNTLNEAKMHNKDYKNNKFVGNIYHNNDLFREIGSIKNNVNLKKLETLSNWGSIKNNFANKRLRYYNGIINHIDDIKKDNTTVDDCQSLRYLIANESNTKSSYQYYNSPIKENNKTQNKEDDTNANSFNILKEYKKTLKAYEPSPSLFKSNKNKFLTIRNFWHSYILNAKASAKPKRNFIFSITQRSYTFPVKDASKISCFKISYVEISTFDKLLYNVKSSIKMLLIFIIYLFLWIYIAVFIKSIYGQYGNKTIDICVMPLVSMLFIKLLIIENFVIFITAGVLYVKGREFLIKAKQGLLNFLLIKILIPPRAVNHYSAITFFVLINKLN